MAPNTAKQNVRSPGLAGLPQGSDVGPFTQAFNQVSSGPVPGLSESQLGVLRGRATQAAEIGADNALSNLFRQTGGSASDPLFLASSASLRAGVPARAAAAAADIDIRESESRRQAEFANRQQMIQLAGLQQAFESLRLNYRLGRKAQSTGGAANFQQNALAASSGIGAVGDFVNLVKSFADVDKESPGNLGSGE